MYGTEMPVDALKIIELCQNGQFYEFMMRALDTPLCVDRKELKSNVLPKSFIVKSVNITSILKLKSLLNISQAAML
jgi:hypothetical protein